MRYYLRNSIQHNTDFADFCDESIETLCYPISNGQLVAPYIKKISSPLDSNYNVSHELSFFPNSIQETPSADAAQRALVGNTLAK